MEEFCLFIVMLLEVDVTWAGLVRTDLAAESERGFPVWKEKNNVRQSEKDIIVTAKSISTNINLKIYHEGNQNKQK